MTKIPLILHVVDRTSGGVPLAVRDYVRHTPDVTHVILSPYTHRRPHEVWNGVEAEHGDLGGGTIARIRSLRETIRVLQPDVVHAHSSFSGFYARTACSKSRQHIVYSPHCFKFDDPRASAPLRSVTLWAERALARRTSTFAVLSAHEGQLARSLGSSAPSILVPNTPTVPTREIPRTRADRPFRVGMIGRLAPQKDPDFFRAIKRSAEDGHADLEWVWVGDGDESLRSRLTTDGIEVTGWLPSDQLVTVLDTLDLYVHSAAYEGFPLSILDAAARRIPIVARRIPPLHQTALTMFDDADSAARIIRRARSDTDYRESLIGSGDQLLEVMSPARQRDMLYAAWGLQAE